MLNRYYSWVEWAGKTVTYGMHSIIYYGSTLVSPIIAKTEYYLIGDLRKLNFSTAAIEKSLKEQASTNGSSFAVTSMGRLGNLAVWYPDNAQQLSYVINILDHEPKGRRPYEVANMLAGGNFFLADTSAVAMIHRSHLVRHLTPARFVTLTEQITAEVINNMDGTREAIVTIVRRVLAKALLNINLSKDQQKEMNYFFRVFDEQASHPLPGVLYFDFNFKNTQQRYNLFVQDILNQQLQLIEQQQRNPGSENPGVIWTALVSLIAKANPVEDAQELLKKMPIDQLREYFKDPYFRTLPLGLIGGNNLIGALVKGMQLATVEDKAIELYNEMTENNLFVNNKLNSHILKTLPRLNDLFQKALHEFNGSSTILRYAEQGLKHGNLTIPPRTTVIIQSQLKFFDPADVNNLFSAPFSVGKRRCPGIVVTEFIFKTVVASMVMQRMLKKQNQHQYELKAG